MVGGAAAAFPGIITTLPGPEALETMLRREEALFEAGGAVSFPDPTSALPVSIGGLMGTDSERCLGTGGWY